MALFLLYYFIKSQQLKSSEVYGYPVKLKKIRELYYDQKIDIELFKQIPLASNFVIRKNEIMETHRDFHASCTPLERMINLKNINNYQMVILSPNHYTLLIQNASGR